MGSLAAMFAESGFEVSGSDENIYPPMSELLNSLGIKVINGFSESNLIPAPELLVVGNACTPSHPEAKYARERGLVQLSFPEALARYFIKDKLSIVVAGTHGKTSTTALAAHLLETAGLDPTYLNGGIMRNTGRTFKVGKGDLFLCEGDEYDAAYFDKRPKFIHYKPRIAIITSVEYDHADIYPDIGAYEAAFRGFIRLVPKKGVVIYNKGCPRAAAIVEEKKIPSLSYGLDDRASVTVKDARWDESGVHFRLFLNRVKVGDFSAPVWGVHNLQNILAVCALGIALFLKRDIIEKALATFQGVKRRQELLCDSKIAVVDDFAHHPTAVRETISAIRQRFPNRRLIAAFDPRSNTSRRRIFEAEYARALAAADIALLTEPQKIVGLAPEERFSAKAVVETLAAKKITAYSLATPNELMEKLLSLWRDGDVVLLMSNGNFGGIIPKIASAAER